MQHPRATTVDRRRMTTGLHAVARRLDADQLDALVVQEWVEDTDGIGTAAHAGHHCIRKPPFGLQHLQRFM